jgi:hypothetical protein
VMRCLNNLSANGTINNENHICEALSYLAST